MNYINAAGKYLEYYFNTYTDYFKNILVFLLNIHGDPEKCDIR